MKYLKLTKQYDDSVKQRNFKQKGIDFFTKFYHDNYVDLVICECDNLDHFFSCLTEEEKKPTHREMTPGWRKTKDRVREFVFAKNPEACYMYARHVLESPCEQVEQVISLSPEWSAKYAVFVLKCPFERGEKAIKKHAYWNSYYKHALPFVMDGGIINDTRTN